MAVKKTFKKRGRDDDEEEEGGIKYKNLIFLAMICGGALPVMMPVFEAIGTLLGGTGYVVLQPDNPELSKVFFSGEPWAILCNNGTAPVPEVWGETAYIKNNDEMSTSFFQMGVLDCGAKLPSGKSTYERFKLKEQTSGMFSSTPQAFWVGGNNKPAWLPQAFLAPRKEKPVEVAPRLLETITSLLKVKKRAVTTNTELNKRCLKHKSCGFVLYPGKKLSAAHSGTINELMIKHRKMAWVVLDTTKKQISIEKSLKPIEGLAEKEQAKEPRFVYFKRDKASKDEDDDEEDEEDAKKKMSTYAKAHKGMFNTDAVAAFLDEVVDGKEEVAFAEMKKLPKISKRGSGKKKSKKKDEPLTEEEKEAAAAAKAAKKEKRAKKAEEKKERDRARKLRKMKEQMDAEDPAEREARLAKEQLKKEKRTRERMDKEQADASPRFLDDDEEVVDLDDDDNEDGEVIDLDDDEEETVDLDDEEESVDLDDDDQSM